MKSTLAILFAIPLAFASCSNEKSDDEEENGASSATGDYPIETCVVSDEKLGSMGDPVEVVHEGTTVKFCCKSCIPEFEKDPEKYIAKLKK